MKKLILPFLLLFISSLGWGQAEAQNADEIDLTDVVVIEDVESEPGSIKPAEEPAAVIEVPDLEIDGASVDAGSPTIPDASGELAEGSEIVLEIPGQEAQSAGEAKKAGEETISVDFPDEDVRTILRNVADLFDLNLVIPDTLQGRTSVKLRNITWRQVFEVVLDPFGFTYVEDRNIIRIKSIAELTTEPVDTRVFVVDYARADEIQGSIAPLIDSSAGGEVRVDKRSNALVITERPSRMNKIQEIIGRLDKPTAQVMIESKFIEVTQNDIKNIGVNWASLSGYSASAGPFQRTYNRETIDEFNRSRNSENTDVGFLNNTQDRAGDVVSRSRPSSPLLPTPSNIDEINDAITNGDPVPGPTYEGFGGTTSMADVFSEVTTMGDSAVFSADQFEVILSALKTSNDIKLVSNPTVVTLDNMEAKIAIGEKYPLPTYSFNAETGERQLDGIEYTDIGITLDVTPQVNSSGFINLNIIPEVSSRLGVAIVESTEIPIIASRRTETNIMVKDGFTLAIGGLSENETGKETSKVPLLGDLPGLGRFFRSSSDRTEQRNLIIFITARTLNPDGSTYRDIIDPRMLDTMGITPSELPGYKIPEEQKELLRRLEEYRMQNRATESSAKASAEIKKIEYSRQQAEKKAEKERKGEK